jgi:hypothetical protein
MITFTSRPVLCIVMVGYLVRQNPNEKALDYGHISQTESSKQKDKLHSAICKSLDQRILCFNIRQKRQYSFQAFIRNIKTNWKIKHTMFNV